MGWEELLDITPGMFLALNKLRAEEQTNQLRNFQFLATVVARSAGHDVNYLPEGDKQGWEGDSLTAFLEARVLQKNGESSSDSGEAVEGTPASDEGWSDSD